MAKEFFKQVPPDEWEKLRKEGRAERYDERELRHVRGMEGELTGERLLSNLDEKKRQELTKAAETIATTVREIQQKLEHPLQERTISSTEISKIKDALSILESSAQRPSPPSHHAKVK